jgi:Putative ATP-dependent DNA helicase recG C-terminal
VAEGELGTEGVTSSRNPVLSALLQEVQLPDSDRVICENRATGIPTMLKQLRRSGTASVKFSNAISHFTVTFTRDAPGTDESRTGSDSARAGGDLTGGPQRSWPSSPASRTSPPPISPRRPGSARP